MISQVLFNSHNLNENSNSIILYQFNLDPDFSNDIILLLKKVNESIEVVIPIFNLIKVLLSMMSHLIQLNKKVMRYLNLIQLILIILAIMINLISSLIILLKLKTLIL